MTLKVFLPYQKLLEKERVIRIVAETTQGSVGFLPKRLDCTAALVPGILTYETLEEGEKYIALEEGVLVKTGNEIVVSTRSGICGADLGSLRVSVEKEFVQQQEKEKTISQALSKIHIDVIRTILEFRHER